MLFRRLNKFIQKSDVGHSENLTEWEQCLLTNTNNNEKNLVTNITDFSCGWTHSLCILENGKLLYYTGSSANVLKRYDGKTFQKINNLIPLTDNQIYTKVISGDHLFSVIINNHLIYYVNYDSFITMDALKETGTIINEIVATLLTNQKGELFAFNNLLNNEKILTKVNLNGFVKCLSAAHTHDDISYQVNDKKWFTYYSTKQNSECVADYYEIQPLYFGCLLYNKKDRKLFAIGNNEDYTLGINSRDVFEELTEVKTINEYLEKNHIDEIIEGCDVTVLGMKEMETKDLKLYLDKLRNCVNGAYLTDVLILQK